MQHNALDVRNLAKEAVLQLETARTNLLVGIVSLNLFVAGSGEIGTFTAEKLSPLVKLFTSTDNILVRQLALWDLYDVIILRVPLTLSQGLRWLPFPSLARQSLRSSASM